MEDKNDQHMLVHAKLLDKCVEAFYLSLVYGKHFVSNRRLWSALCRAHDVVGSVPWLIGGDFNIVRNCTESMGGGSSDAGGINEFNDCIRSINVMEYPHSDNNFTCSRNWKTYGLVRVLDRILCSGNWLLKFPSYTIDILVVNESDHYSLDVDLHNNIAADSKLFKYKHFWSFHASFKDSWCYLDGGGRG
ncbi:hypothetical protein LIER_14835 [Lithospermum erythrorhizon]|uniref:Endonuclease/exonuclease/phosphatase domain-containing protein n=1 Tax=Lithospermum erythrorhizon TaxID=34254 RepID=A0AAV3Q240_LITER